MAGIDTDMVRPIHGLTQHEVEERGSLMRRIISWGAAATAMLSATCASAQTETAPPAASTGQLETVVVTGVRQSLENAIETKRTALSVVDVISAEDVGKFPTENVAESLQRVTGVQISRLRGEGQNVTIRGLPSEFTLVQLNGRTLTSALGPSSAGISRGISIAAGCWRPRSFTRTSCRRSCASKRRFR